MNRYLKMLLAIILVLLGSFGAAVTAQYYATGPQCQAWGWTNGYGGVCYGVLDSGEKIQKSLAEIKSQTCVGPYVIIQPTKRDKHPVNCPSGIFFSGSHPYFQNLKISGKNVSY